MFLAFAMSCTCEVDLKSKNCFMVTISDGLPFQWYLNGIESFNTKVNPFTEEACFHQEFKCTSNVINRIIDDENNDYVLRAYKNGLQLGADIPMVRTPIVNEGIAQFENSSFIASLVPWLQQNIGVNTEPWGWSSYNGGSAAVTLTGTGGGGTSSQRFYQDYNFVAGRTYKIKIKGESNLLAASVALDVRLTNVGTAYLIAVPTEMVGGVFEFEFEVTPVQDCDRFRLSVTNTNIISTDLFLFDIDIVSESYGGIHEAQFTPQVQGFCGEELSFKIHNEDDDSVIAYTDGIIFNEETQWSLIKYKKSTTFAGIFYDVNSPLFEVYFPFQFSRNRIVASTKTTKLSNGLEFNTASEISTNRRLLTAPMADYMHKKLHMVLQHATGGVVEIDGKEWTWKEGYDYIDPPAEDGPLQQGSVFLTDKNDGVRNVL
jgi:hypothetical protein